MLDGRDVDIEVEGADNPARLGNSPLLRLARRV